jgi:hypothetical protein
VLKATLLFCICPRHPSIPFFVPSALPSPSPISNPRKSRPGLSWVSALPSPVLGSFGRPPVSGRDGRPRGTGSLARTLTFDPGARPPVPGSFGRPPVVGRVARQFLGLLPKSKVPQSEGFAIRKFRNSPPPKTPPSPTLCKSILEATGWEPRDRGLQTMSTPTQNEGALDTPQQTISTPHPSVTRSTAQGSEGDTGRGRKGLYLPGPQGPGGG